MPAPPHNSRTPFIEVDCMFPDRWSPRAFDPTPLSAENLAALFEAARWAPSCFNEQPWLFLYAQNERDRDIFLSLLVDKNRSWACRAPLLLFLLTRRHFRSNGRPNRHAAFDAGAAWMSLSLQARRLGLYAHAMAGFKQDLAYEALNVSRDDYEIMAAIAVGRYGDAELLSDELLAMEQPNGRKPWDEMAIEGKFFKQKEIEDKPED